MLRVCRELQFKYQPETNSDKMKPHLFIACALLSGFALLHAADLTGISEADGTVNLKNNYVIKLLSPQEEARIKTTQVMLRRLLETYGTKRLFCVSNKPGQPDMTIVLTINSKGVKDLTTIEEEIAKAREAKIPLMLQVTSRMAGGGGSQIGPSPVDLILDATAGLQAAPAGSPIASNGSSVPALVSSLVTSSQASSSMVASKDGDLSGAMLPTTTFTTINKVNLTFPIPLARGAQIRKATPEEKIFIKSLPTNDNALNTVRIKGVTLASLKEWYIHERPGDGYPYAIIWNVDGAKAANIEEQLADEFAKFGAANHVLRFQVAFVSLGDNDRGLVSRDSSYTDGVLSEKGREKLVAQEQIEYLNPFQPTEVDTREFVSTLLPSVMGDQLVAVEYSEGSFYIDGVPAPKSKRIALHRTLDDSSWYDQWLIGAKPRDTNYKWDDSGNLTLHPKGGIPDPKYEDLLRKVGEATGIMLSTRGYPRNSFVESIVKNVAVMRVTETHIQTVNEAKGRLWFAPLSLFSPATQRYMKKEYWRLMPSSSSLREALAEGDQFAKVCADEFRFVNYKALQESAGQGDSEALNVLGRCYLKGVSYGDQLREAHEGNVARWLPKSEKFHKDPERAVELLKAAAEKGSIEACLALGEHLSSQSDQEHLGRLYYLIAAYVGHPLAHLNLALKYRNMKRDIPNMTKEQRERRAVWHFLRAINCNREFMGQRVRGETLRVMCYDLAGDTLDSLEPDLHEYAKRELQKIKLPWPMTWDRAPAKSGAGILAAAEEWQKKLDDYFKNEELTKATQ